MISKINNPEVIEFIQNHLDEDPAEIALQANKYPDLPIREIADQIASRQKAKSKLPEWWGRAEIIFPPKENLEQASSESIARFKSRWINGKSIMDLTGGSGIDLFYMSKGFDRVMYVEPNQELADITEFNFQVFSKHPEVYVSTAEEFLSKASDQFDVIYLDPSRRNVQKQRVFGLEEYQPNVVDLYELLLEKGKEILVKTSPMIDIKSTLKLLPDTFKVQVVAVDNEVKEVLFYLKKRSTNSPEIEAWNISDMHQDEKFAFTFNEEREATSNFSKVQNYVYEPNSAIRKAGAFNLISTRFGLKKLHPNTHLYTSAEVADNFPGRVFEVKEYVKPGKKEIRKAFPDGKVNVISKNYPIGANEIKKKFRLKDGGEEFLIFCTQSDDKRISIRVRIIHK